MAIIYKIENKQNGKIYIGQTKRTLDWRLNNSWCGHFHLAFNANSSGYLHTALRKYGKDSFTYEIIEENNNLAKEELKKWLNEREEYWIAYYQSNKHEFGYNKTKGGSSDYEVANHNYHSERMTQYNNAFWSNEENRQKRSKQVSEQFKKQWKNPEYKAKVLKKMKESANNKSKEERHTSAMKSVETRRNNGTLSLSEASKAKIKSTLTELWQDNNYRQRQSENKRGNTNVKGRIHVYKENEDYRMIKPEQLEEFLANGYIKGTGHSHHHYLTEEEKYLRRQKMIEKGTLDKLRDVSKAAATNKGSKILYKNGVKKVFKKEEVDSAKINGWLPYKEYLENGGILTWVNDGRPSQVHKAKFALLYKNGKQKRIKPENYEAALADGWLPYKEYLASGGELSWRFPKRGKCNENKEN